MVYPECYLLHSIATHPFCSSFNGLQWSFCLSFQWFSSMLLLIMVSALLCLWPKMIFFDQPIHYFFSNMSKSMMPHNRFKILINSNIEKNKEIESSKSAWIENLTNNHVQANQNSNKCSTCCTKAKSKTKS